MDGSRRAGANVVSVAGGSGGGSGSGGSSNNNKNGIGDALDQQRAASSMEQLWQVYVTVSKRELQFQSSSQLLDKVCTCAGRVRDI